MKAYISIPISGRPIIDAKCQAERIKAKLTEHGHECITPFDVCPESGKPYILPLRHRYSIPTKRKSCTTTLRHSWLCAMPASVPA